MSASARTGTPAVYLYNCPTRTQHPHQIVLACGDANTYVSNIVWRYWAAPSAFATGIFHWNSCTPNCAAGTFHTKDISFSATARRRVRGVWLYTALRARASTWRTGSAVFSLPTSPL